MSHKTMEAKQSVTAHFMLATQLLKPYFEGTFSRCGDVIVFHKREYIS